MQSFTRNSVIRKLVECNYYINRHRSNDYNDIAV